MKIPWTWKKAKDRYSKSRDQEHSIHRVHLGVDYGTSWSKLVFRDTEARGGERSIVVRDSQNTVPDNYRISSLIAFDGDKLYFGSQCVRRMNLPKIVVFPSMKVQVAFPNHFHQIRRSIPQGLTEEGLAALTILYLLQIGKAAAETYLNPLGARPQVTITIGAPMSQLDNPDLKRKFIRMATLASSMAQVSSQSLENGISIGDAVELLHAANSALGDSPPKNPDVWVRSEANAALLWAFRSPDVPSGLYGAVDVGAGTTSASWFRIKDNWYEDQWIKESIVFYGAACLPPGADAVEEVIAKSVGIQDPLQVRGKANQYVSALDPQGKKRVSNLCAKIFETYRLAFRRAYKKEQRITPWNDTRIFLLGGGTQIQPIRTTLYAKPWNMLDRSPPPLDPGRPSDLYETAGTRYTGDTHNLLVAYGLSHLVADIPEATPPSGVTEYKPDLPTREPISHEDIYSD